MTYLEAKGNMHCIVSRTVSHTVSKAGSHMKPTSRWGQTPIATVGLGWHK
jgi:hypothetical protein